MIELVGGGGGIKSIQRGTFVAGGTKTETFPLSPVNLERTSVGLQLRAEFADSGNMTNTPYLREITDDAIKLQYYAGWIVEWAVIEYRAAKVQRGFLSNRAGGVNDYSISPVNPDKARAVTDNQLKGRSDYYATATLVGSEILRIESVSGLGHLYWEVIEHG